MERQRSYKQDIIRFQAAFPQPVPSVGAAWLCGDMGTCFLAAGTVAEPCALVGSVGGE